MPLIILGVIVIIAAIFIFTSYNAGTKKRVSGTYSDFSNSNSTPKKEEPDENGKVIFLFNEVSNGDEDSDVEKIEDVSITTDEEKKESDLNDQKEEETDE